MGPIPIVVEIKRYHVMLALQYRHRDLGDEVQNNPASIASRIHSSADTGNEIDDFVNTVTGVTHPALWRDGHYCM
jgi:hypothetical protein